MASCGVIIAIILVLLTTVATIVAFATPNWLHWRGINDQLLCRCLNCDCGLWLRCSGSITSARSLDNCRWFLANDFQIEKTLPMWFKAVQGLASVAVASSLISLLVGLFSLCCTSKCCNPHQCAGAFMNLTCLLLIVTVCVFAAKAHIDHRAEVTTKDNNFDPIFGWSFWVAVGATVLSFISSGCYFCVGRKDEYA